LIKVLHVVGETMCRAGMESFIMNMYRCINREVFQFGFLVRSYEKGDFDEEISSLGGEKHVIFIDEKDFFLTRLMKRFFDIYKLLKKRTDYRVVHIHTSSANKAIELIAAWLAGCKIRIVHAHNTETKRSKLHKRLRFLLRFFSTHRLACGTEAGKWVFGPLFLTINNAQVIPNAIDIRPFIFNPGTRELVKEELSLDGNFVVGHIGRFSETKNHMFLLNIFYELTKLRDDAVLVLIGSGPLEKMVKEKAFSMGLEKKVLFLGVRPDINRLLMAMDCFVLPSLYEGLPVVLVEAQASGLKAVVSDRVTKEAAITDNIKYIPLEEAPEQWANVIHNMTKDKASLNDRSDMKESLSLSGYNMNEQVKEIEKIYTKA